MKRTITILNTQRTKGSNGFPRYFVSFFEFFNGRKYYAIAITEANSSVGLCISEFCGCTVEVEFSKRRKYNLPVITAIKALGGNTSESY